MKVIIKPYKVNISRILDLQDIILAYKRAYNKIEITNNSIVEMEKEINNTSEEYCKYQQNRIKQFKSLLYKYWILQYKGCNIPTMYIYPYEINLENNYLFALVSPINDYLFNKNGLFEDSFNIFDSFGKETLIFTECTKEEMLGNAKIMCKKALDSRLNKIKNKIVC